MGVRWSVLSMVHGNDFEGPRKETRWGQTNRGKEGRRPRPGKSFTVGSRLKIRKPRGESR